MTEIAAKGTILRAENGDVIGYDETGLLMHLSDRVIADIAARLDLAPSTLAPPNPDAVFSDDLDVWDMRAKGDWFYFQGNLLGADSLRGYRRHKDHPTILAQSHLPLMAVLGIGGARAGLATAGHGLFPYHLMAPADDIGAVGLAGEGAAIQTPFLEPLREMTHEAILAETLLLRRRDLGAGLPLFFVRTETDFSATATDLGQGRAVENLEMALQNLIAAAAFLGSRPKLAAICLDYCLEDVAGDPLSYRDGILALMTRITRKLAALGLPEPVFLSGFDCGTHRITTGAALEGQWELSWNHGAHHLLFTCPSYAFEIDDTGRLTDQGRRQKAEISAEALLSHQNGENWICPRLQLAERDGSDIRLTFAAADRLFLDPADPFGAGANAGFRLDGVTNDAVITLVEIDPKDPKAVILRCSTCPQGNVYVSYAFGAKAGNGPYPANAGALRDGWHGTGRHGPLHRWALPARLMVT